MPPMLAAAAQRKKVAASAARQWELHCSPTVAWLAARVGFPDEEEMSCPLQHHAAVGCFIPVSAYGICGLKHGISSRDIIYEDLSLAGSLAAMQAAGPARPGDHSVARTRSPKELFHEGRTDLFHEELNLGHALIANRAANILSSATAV
ncbi:hypothetical protein Dimus_007587 [Dionaea muscipula]